MKYTLTPSESSKLLKKIIEEKAIILANEAQSSTFNAALGEDVESVRPIYDYESTCKMIADFDEKIRIIKHAINCFNTTTVVGDTRMTIDQLLVYIPQLTEKRNKLYDMQARLPKKRTSVSGYGNNSVIDYRYTNYDVEQVKKDYMAVSDELRRVQTALDLANSTLKLEFALND